jgi:hypothetical protein
MNQVAHNLLYKWYKNPKQSLGGILYLTEENHMIKISLLQNSVNYGMFLFVKMEGLSNNSLDIEGELTDDQRNIQDILTQECSDGWVMIGGKEISSLDYFFPEEIILQR